jgi:RNA polymerase sigma-70 factor, ECF subfamily
VLFVSSPGFMVAIRVRGCLRSCATRLSRGSSAIGPPAPPAEFDENIHLAPNETPTLEASLLRKADSAMIRGALDELLADFREVVVLRDFEELSYKEIGDIAEIPVGTVMSRLARARAKLACSITVRVKEA